MAIRLPYDEKRAAEDLQSHHPRVKSAAGHYVGLGRQHQQQRLDNFTDDHHHRTRDGARRYPSWFHIASTSFIAVSLCYLVYNLVVAGGRGVGGSYRPDVISPWGSPAYDAYVPCYGPRGKLLSENPDDQIQEMEFDDPLALYVPFGSYKDLQLKRTWATPDGRYGPYGRYQDNDQADHPRSRADWKHMNWASMQNNCTARNRDRFGGDVKYISPERRMAYPNSQNGVVLPPRPPRTTGRTAIVLRGWEEMVFKAQDKWSLRSIIVEAALSYGGDNAVFLLIDVHDPKWKIFKSRKNYDKALNAIVPAEFRDMAVLFDVGLLEAWYPKTPEHALSRQIFQPLQLFARFFSDFDHFWQLEMDARFTGHAGRILEAMSTFARNEPRKQAYERSTYLYSELMYGGYSNFISAVNKSLDGGSQFWSGVQIEDLEKIGPEPPVARAEDDDFRWGVGEDADVLLLGQCHNLTRSSRAEYRDYFFNFKSSPRDAQRAICPPASSRSSWNILNAIHTAQVEKGLAVPSEATTVSFAFWLNLKISRPPFPIFLKDKHDPAKLDLMVNGGAPSRERHGRAHGMQRGTATSLRRKFGILFDEIAPTWRPRTHQAQEAVDAWLEGKKKEPWVRPLYVYNGEVWMPNTIMHPVKTNPNGNKNVTLRSRSVDGGAGLDSYEPYDDY